MSMLNIDVKNKFSDAKVKAKSILSSKNLNKTIKFLGSPQAVNTVKLAVALVTLFQAIDAIRDQNRKIGFTNKNNK